MPEITFDAANEATEWFEAQTQIAATVVVGSGSEVKLQSRDTPGSPNASATVVQADDAYSGGSTNYVRIEPVRNTQWRFVQSTDSADSTIHFRGVTVSSTPRSLSSETEA